MPTVRHYSAMKPFLTSTTENLVAMLARFCISMRANRPGYEGLEYRRRGHGPLSADASRIPAYLRRNRLRR